MNASVSKNMPKAIKENSTATVTLPAPTNDIVPSILANWELQINF